MLSKSNRKSSIGEVLKFTYPKLHTGKNWYVDFMSFDPAIGKMKRKKYMLDSIPKVSDRKKRAAELVEALTRQLRQGWSPWVNVEDNRGYTLMVEALAKYEQSIERFVRYKTRKSYSSKLTIFRDFLKSRLLQPKYVYQYDSALVTDFLDYVYLDRGVNARSRNNYRGWCSSLALFFMEREFIASNPVDKVGVLKEEPKKRQPLTEQMLRRLREWLLEHDPHFLLACTMEYYMFIRPEELRHVKIRDINLSEQSIVIAADVSKNGRDGKVGINDEVVKLMLDLGIFASSGDCYLFSKDFKPGMKISSSDIFNKRWCQHRQKLKWGDEYQFYSLKDSGLRDLANAEGIIIARDQARHTDVATTNKYLQGKDLPIHAETKHFKGLL